MNLIFNILLNFVLLLTIIIIYESNFYQNVFYLVTTDHKHLLSFHFQLFKAKAEEMDQAFKGHHFKK